MPKVLIAERVCDKAITLFEEKGIEVVYEPHISREDLLATIDQYDGLVVRSIPTVDEELLAAGTNLKVVGRAGNGVDNINMDAATKRGVVVVNTPDANSISACELTIGMIIASSRNIPQANNFIKGGQWGRSRFQGSELRGKTLGIIGLGRIGSAVAQRVAPFGVKVIAYDPYITDARFQRVNAEKKETLEDLLREADILTIHTPKTKETFGMVNRSHLPLFKQGIRIVNCARGGLIEEEMLVEGLKSGIIKSAACDVLRKEPCTESPLYEFDNFIVTPHIGATTDEAQEMVGITVAKQVSATLLGDMVSNAVNLPVLHNQDMRRLQPYILLAESLGRFYHQIEHHAVDRIEINYAGTVSELETEFLTLAVLKGVFEPILKEQVNYVNASLVAKERGITVIETKVDHADNYLSLLTVKIIAGARTYCYAGTLFGLDEPRIVDINNFHFELAPAENMLVVENADAPGMVGKLGTALGANNINIANMQVSCNDSDGRAMMVLEVDSPVSREQLDALMAVAGIDRVSFIQL